MKNSKTSKRRDLFHIDTFLRVLKALLTVLGIRNNKKLNKSHAAEDQKTIPNFQHVNKRTRISPNEVLQS